MKISVVIPAHNEEQYIQRCLQSIQRQIIPTELNVQIIVVLNRCTDRTGEIAQNFGAKILCEDSKNLSAIKNKGVQHADTEWVVTIDADSWMSEGVLAEIHRYAQSPDCLGGG